MTSHTSTVNDFAGTSAEGELDYGDQAIADAIKKVQAEDDDTTFVVVGYVPGTNKLRVEEVGDGDLEDLADEMSDAKVLYAYTRVTQGALKKFVYITWVGNSVPPVRKGVVVTGGHGDLVGRHLFKHFSVQINARSENDLDVDIIMDKVKKAGGADYDSRGAQSQGLGAGR